MLSVGFYSYRQRIKLLNSVYVFVLPQM